MLRKIGQTLRDVNGKVRDMGKSARAFWWAHVSSAGLAPSAPLLHIDLSRFHGGEVVLDCGGLTPLWSKPIRSNAKERQEIMDAPQG